jgi:putative transposase
MRLDTARNAIIHQAIQSEYLTTQKKPVSKVILEIQQQCWRAGLPPPGHNTVRRRVQQLSEEEKVRLRWSKKMAKSQFEPMKKNFPGADYPLAVVQMDHTQVDIILVDEVYRQPLGRPYITMATDVFSRMVLGFYLSFDPPGAISAGLCVAQAILPKETLLIGMQGDWPCWGLPTVLHLDNAKEFRGKMLERACEKYGIRLEFRPVKTPHWGGNVERLMRTFMEETHTLPGTTFSNVQDRKEYDSEKNAVLTLPEFEQWLTTFIVNVYHKRIHKALNVSPFERYKDGIFGAPGQIGIGLPDRLYDELQIRLDFMPGHERTVQEYGVVIDHVFYYADVLKHYINSLEPGFGKNRSKRQFIFKRDPRDISCIYFLDPNTNQYHRIPYRNTEYPAISVWEFRQALARVKLKGMAKVDQGSIFAAYDEMKKVALDAIERTRRVNRSSNRLVKGVPLDTLAVLLPAPTSRKTKVSAVAPETLPADRIQKERPLIVPFDEIEDDALKPRDKSASRPA